jgi:hypothetical protein
LARLSGHPIDQRRQVRGGGEIEFTVQVDPHQRTLTSDGEA